VSELVAAMLVAVGLLAACLLVMALALGLARWVVRRMER
jgi:hypothetical protein